VPGRTAVYTYDSIASGLAERRATLRLEVFPSPAADEITIRMPEPASGSHRYSVLSVDGRPVAGGWLDRNPIGVSALAAGVYFIRIEGMTKGFGRFVKR